MVFFFFFFFFFNLLCKFLVSLLGSGAETVPHLLYNVHLFQDETKIEEAEE